MVIEIIVARVRLAHQGRHDFVFLFLDSTLAYSHDSLAIEGGFLFTAIRLGG
jgi:hypothetical protein